MAKVEDLKVKLVLDDAQAQTVLAEMLRGAAALEELLQGLGKVLTSPEGQAIIVDALAGRIKELKEEVGRLRRRYDDLVRFDEGVRRALALQFEEGDAVELQVACFGLAAGSILTVETTPVTRGADGKVCWGEDAKAPTTAMCSHPSRVGNIEIPLINLRLFKHDGRPVYGRCETCSVTSATWLVDTKRADGFKAYMCCTCMVQHIVSLENQIA